MTEQERQFSYSEKDFVFLTGHGDTSKFDQRLRTIWQNKMIDGCFRYQLGDLESRCPEGKFNFIVQLNIKRAVQRRSPQFILDMMMPFDNKLFHFGKVDEKEFVFTIQPKHWSELKPENSTEAYKHALIINVSPLEFGHSLLVPCLDKYSPQVLNFNALRLAVEIMLLSCDSYFRVGFNSLGAYASVNHLHFHTYYLKHKLYLESAPVVHLKGRCYELTSFPSEGFAFEVLKEEDILEVVRSVMDLIDFLVEKQIPHNVFLTRGDGFIPSEKQNDQRCSVRLYVWPRQAYYGLKYDLCFNVAVCELAGHVPIKEKISFECISEEDICQRLHETCHNTYSSIRNEVKKLYE